MQDKDIQSWPLEFGPGIGLDLQADYAAITLLPVEPDGVPRIEASAEALKVMKFDISRTGSDVQVRVRHVADAMRNWLNWGKNRHLVVFLPQGLHAKVRAEAGKVTARDLSLGQLEITADAGAILLGNVRGHLRLRALAGKIEGEDIAGALSANSSTGAIRMRIRELDPGIHTIQADVGSVKVEIARSAQIQLDVEASLGSVTTDFPSTPGAPATLRVSATVGSVKVRAVDLGSPLSEKPDHSPLLVAPARVPVDLELERVLRLVEEGKLSAQDAGEILKALQES